MFCNNKIILTNLKGQKLTRTYWNYEWLFKRVLKNTNWEVVFATYISTKDHYAVYIKNSSKSIRKKSKRYTGKSLKEDFTKEIIQKVNNISRYITSIIREIKKHNVKTFYKYDWTTFWSLEKLWHNFNIYTISVVI